MSLLMTSPSQSRAIDNGHADRCSVHRRAVRRGIQRRRRLSGLPDPEDAEDTIERIYATTVNLVYADPLARKGLEEEE